MLEGTYPYRMGGVSTWTHALIRGLPEHRFTVLHLHAAETEPGEVVFARPSNLVAVCPLPLPPDLAADDLPAHLAARAAGTVPDADVVHALSTGFAGLIGAAIAGQRPFLLTEHGLYWREIERGAAEVEAGLRLLGRPADRPDTPPCGARRRWVERFRTYARRAYARADAIATVCRANQKAQRALGADAARCHLIPNGVARVPVAPPRKPSRFVPHIGLVGRVVSLKDVKTFIRTAHRVQQHRPATRFFVIGPTGEDPGYFRACRRLVRQLRLRHFTFTGPADAHAWYPRLDVVALTSRSEAQPLALMEAMAHGRPVVTTDVGGCRALVKGHLGTDRHDGFGPAGLVRPVGHPPALARALLRLLERPALRRRLGNNGRQRVRARYPQSAFIEPYRRLYAAHAPAEGQVRPKDQGRPDGPSATA